MKFRLVRQPEMAYITEQGRLYGEKDAPRMSWEPPSGHLFRAGWEEVDMGSDPQAIGQRIRSYLIRIR